MDILPRKASRWRYKVNTLISALENPEWRTKLTYARLLLCRRVLICLVFSCLYLWWFATQVAQTVKCLPAMRKTRVQFLGWEDPLEKEMAIHSSTLAWKIPWKEEPDRLQSMGSQRIGHDWATSLSLSIERWISYKSASLGFLGAWD